MFAVSDEIIWLLVDDCSDNLYAVIENAGYKTASRLCLPADEKQQNEMIELY